jgi:hypothetical protein
MLHVEMLVWVSILVLCLVISSCDGFVLTLGVHSKTATWTATLPRLHRENTHAMMRWKSSPLAAKILKLEFDPVTRSLKEWKPSPEKVKPEDEIEGEWVDNSFREEDEIIQNYDLLDKYINHEAVRCSVEENRKKLSYPSQRVAWVLLLRAIVRAVREQRVTHIPDTVAQALAYRKRIKIKDMVLMLRKEHQFRESLMATFGLPKDFKFPSGMDALLFEGELDFDLARDILLQNIYVSKEERKDIREFYSKIGQKVVDMTVVEY